MGNYPGRKKNPDFCRLGTGILGKKWEKKWLSVEVVGKVVVKHKKERTKSFVYSGLADLRWF